MASSFWNYTLDVPSIAPHFAGAFPTASTWYISAGAWPQGSGSDQSHLEEEIPLTERVSLVKNAVTGKYEHSFKPSARLNRDTLVGARSLQGAPNNTYSMQIVKTTDAGATWTTKYFKLGFGYFNGGFLFCGNGIT